MSKQGATKRGCKKIGRAAPHWVKKNGRKYKKCGKKLKRRAGSRRRRMNLTNMSASFPTSSSLLF